MIKTPKWKGGKVFFTADTHFSHHRIIEYAERPFSTTDEMDATLISNWNSVVGENDVVFCLGDFGLGSSQKLKKYLESTPWRNLSHHG